MAFRASNTTFGAFGVEVRLFADSNGQVPERGDLARNFSYGPDYSHRPCGERWPAFVARAVRATAEAEAAVEAWREAWRAGR
jgi:hypothetical protein